MPRDTHQRQLCELIADSWYAGDGVISVLERAMTECYEAFHPELPTIADVKQRVEDAKAGGREAMWRQSALRILNQLTTGQLGRIFCRRRDTAALDRLLSEHTVIELDGLAVNDAAFLTQHLMRYLTQSLLTRQEREQLQFVCLVEEAHHLLAKTPRGSESILETCLREGREIGLGIMLVDQTPASISPVALANCFSVAVLNCRQHSDIQAAAGTLLLDQEQRAMLSTLPVGEAVARLSDRWPRPVHIRVPPLLLPKGQVSDEDVRLAFLAGPYSAAALGGDSSLSGHSIPNRDQDTSGEAFTLVPLADEKQRASDSSSHPPTQRQARQHPPNHPRDAATDPLREDPELRLLLEHIAKHPLMGVAARFDELGLSRRKGNALKIVLAREGFIEQVGVTTATGRTVLLALTEQAKQWLQRHRVPITTTNGSLPHAWWQQRAAELLQETGWKVQPECQYKGHTFDLFAERGGEQLLLEVETGRSDWLKNFACLEKVDVSRKLVVWLDDASFLRARSSLPAGAEILRPRELERWVKVHLA